MIAQGALLEYAEYCGNYYGTPRVYVERQLDAGRNVILEIETEGAFQIRRQCPETVLIFIAPPDYPTLKRRLTGRGTEPPEIIEKRLQKAQKEIDRAALYDHVVINPDGGVQRAASDIRAIKDGAYTPSLGVEAFIRRFKQTIR